MYRNEMLRLTTLVLFLIAATRVLGQTDPVTAETVIARYLDALGGEMALLEYESTYVKEAIVFTNRNGEFDQDAEHWYKGRKYLTKESNGMVWGYDGEQNWSSDGVFSDPDRPTYPANAGDPVGFPLHLANFPGELTVVSATGDNAPVRLRATWPDATPPRVVPMWPREFQFDRDTGLLTAIVFEHGTITFSDYRRVGSIVVPHARKREVTIADLEATYVFQIKSIEFNIELNDAMFEPDM